MNDVPERREAGVSAKAGVDWKKTGVVCGLILLAAAAVVTAIFFTEPSATRSGAVKRTAMLVDVARVEQGTYRPIFVVTGTVEAEQDIVLRSQVGGEIMKRAEDFAPGAFVRKGQRLLSIEAADYKHALEQRKSALRQARADLQIEMGRQKVARREYELFDDDSPGASEEASDKALVLRAPQLEAARGRVEAAEAAVEQAKLDLRRTTIEAPFAAQVLSREVNLGSQVSPGDALGRLVGLETYWVVATVPPAALRWIPTPDGSEGQGAEVRIRNQATWPEGVYRTGHLERVIGALDEQTRMARLHVAIPDPLARRTDAPALMVGEFVEVRISGKQIADVVAVDRDYVRDDDTVWVMEDGKLRVRDVDIAVRDAERAYISRGLEHGERIVTSNLATVTDGAQLRVRGDQEPPAE